MNVSLTPELEKFVAQKVESGRYSTASEVIREGLRLLQEKEEDREASIAHFNEEIQKRLASLDRGEYVDPEEVLEGIRQRSLARRKLSA
jgi:antitoxin ParD1/3/4